MIGRKVSTMGTAVACTEVQLSQLNRETPEGLRLVLMAGVGDALSVFGFKADEMPEAVLEFVVENIIETYWYLHIEDIAIVFKNACRGRYEKLYGRLDGSVILSWFAAYDRERNAYLENMPRPKEEETIGDWVSPERYARQLEAKAAKGDREAEQALHIHRKIFKGL